VIGELGPHYVVCFKVSQLEEAIHDLPYSTLGR
jgi:hypothetical protein